MFGALFHQFNKLDNVTGAGTAVRAKTAIGIGGRVDLHTGCFVRMEGTKQPVVFISLQVVMLQYLVNGQLGFDVF